MKAAQLNDAHYWSLTLEAPVVLHYLKAPTPVKIKLTGVSFIAF
jgi:hypothetical protein